VDEKMLVSHFVAEELLEKIDDTEALKQMLDKFRQRYPRDTDFKALCETFDRYLDSYDEKVLDEFKENLKNFHADRKGEGGGGSTLPFSDRRHMREDRSRR